MAGIQLRASNKTKSSRRLLPLLSGRKEARKGEDYRRLGRVALDCLFATRSYDSGRTLSADRVLQNPLSHGIVVSGV